jgi:tRNA modification GTPase
MLGADTIVAIASPPGRAARAIVRLSGAGVRDALLACVAPAPARAGASIVGVRLGGERTLPALLIYSQGPRSYTGQDSAEILFAGAPALAQRVVSRLLETPGLRPAGPGEFSARAFLAGRLTLEQAEGVAALIGAENEEQLEAAREMLSGSGGERRRGLADELAGALALVEAGIDFTDQEDVVAIAPADLAERLRRVAEGIDALLGPAGGAPVLDAPARVVLAGAPNSGKSTLFNALLGRRRAVVSPEPGATRDALEEPLDLTANAPGRAGLVTLVDIAGLDGALAGRSGLDAAAQARARATVEGADIVVLCDPAGRFGAAFPIPRGAATLRVRTMCDLPGAGVGAGASAWADAIGVCAIDGWNLRALRRAIADAAVSARAGGAAHVWPRHRAALSAARAALAEALERAAPQAGRRALGEAELIAEPMRRALDALGEISGRVSADDVLGRVFASFCVGK